MNRIVRNAAVCYGCKMCQLVCSFHHTGTFWPERSSIRVSRNPQKGTVKWQIDTTCDLCRSEGKPVCVRNCSYEALRIDTAQEPKESDRE